MHPWQGVLPCGSGGGGLEFGPRLEFISKSLSILPDLRWVSSGDEPSPTFSRISSTFSSGKGSPPTPPVTPSSPMELCSINSKQVSAAFSALPAFYKFHLAKNSPVLNPSIKVFSLAGGGGGVLCAHTGQPSLYLLDNPICLSVGVQTFWSSRPQGAAGVQLSAIVALLGEGRCAAGTGDELEQETCFSRQQCLRTHPSPVTSDLLPFPRPGDCASPLLPQHPRSVLPFFLHLSIHMPILPPIHPPNPQSQSRSVSQGI